MDISALIPLPLSVGSPTRLHSRDLFGLVSLDRRENSLHRSTGSSHRA